MMTTVEKKTDAQKMAFESHMAHFEAIRNDMNVAGNFQNNVVNFSIAIIGGTIALFALKNEKGISFLSQYPYIYLIVSIMLSLLTWVSLEAEIRIHDHARYIDTVLSKKVRKLIGDMPGNEYEILTAEMGEISRYQKVRTYLRGLLVSGKFFVPYFPAVILLVLYFNSIQYASTKEYFARFLLILAIFTAVVVPISIFVQAIFVSRYYWSKQ